MELTLYPYAHFRETLNEIYYSLCFSVVRPHGEEGYVRRIEFTVEISALGSRYL